MKHILFSTQLTDFSSLFSFQKINEDADLIFDDNPDAKSNHLHVVSKRSYNQLNKITDKDVEEMLHTDLTDNDEHWLWGHVSRIKRSFWDNMFDSDTEEEPKKEISEETKEEEQEVKRQPEHEQTTKSPPTHKGHHKSHKKHKHRGDHSQRHKQSNHHADKQFDQHAGHENQLLDHAVVEKAYVVPRINAINRLKRQFSDDDDDEPDNVWYTVEENEIVGGSGAHHFDINKFEFASKPHRTCEYFVLIQFPSSPTVCL